MTFLDFFHAVFGLFGSAGSFLLIFLGLVVALGVYKFVKDWLPW